MRGLVGGNVKVQMTIEERRRIESLIRQAFKDVLNCVHVGESEEMTLTPEHVGLVHELVSDIAEVLEGS